MMKLRCYYARSGHLGGHFEGNEVLIDTLAWRYDDAKHDRVGEPFVMGASEMIDVLRCLDGLPEERTPFTLVFSDEPFEGAHMIEHVSADEVGDWYQWKGQQFWLCPALLDFFPQPPEAIWVEAKE